MPGKIDEVRREVYSPYGFKNNFLHAVIAAYLYKLLYKHMILLL